MFFKKKKNELQARFDKIEEEFSTVHEWLHYFHDFNQHLLDYIRSQDERINVQEDDLDEVKITLQNMPKTKEDFKELVDYYYSFDSVMDRLRTIENRLESIESRPIPVQKVIKNIESRPSNIREKVLKKIARSSKEYIKNLVLNLVSKYGKVSALQLREMIVEEQGLCSKSSFYRILEELEHEDLLNIVSKGKLKVYLAGQEKLRISE